MLKHQKDIKLVNKCNIVVDESLLIEAMLWYSKKFLLGVKKISIYGKYPCVSIGKEKIHVHRLLLKYLNKDVDISMFHVDHINGNKLDARVENLRLLTPKVHMSLTNKGRIFKQEHRVKIGLANKRRKGIKIKKRHNIPLEEVKLMLQDGASINAIAKHFKVDWTTIRSRIYENPELIQG